MAAQWPRVLRRKKSFKIGMPEGSVISKPDERSWKIVGSYLGAGEDFPPRSICAIDHAKKTLWLFLY